MGKAEVAGVGVLLLVATHLWLSGSFGSTPPAGALVESYAVQAVGGQYCAAPIQYGEEGGVGRLLQVQVAFRHGDRSAIHTIPHESVGTSQGEYLCDDSEIVSSGQSWRDLMQGFSVRDVRSDTDIPNKLASATLGGAGGATVCAPGQLTARGVDQHLSLGGALRTRLGAAFMEAVRPGDVYARSTYYTRTIQSAAALLTGLLGGSAAAQQVPILTSRVEGAEPMKGIGLVRGFTSYCPRAQALFDAAKREEAELVAPLMSTLRREFGLSEEEGADWSITDLAEVLYARGCHDLARPCSSPGSCLSAVQAEEVLRLADEVYGIRARSAPLRLYPLLREIAGRMRSREERVALYSGHDTVIAPLLQALGAFDDEWPPYASHVVFELYESEEDPGGAVRVLYNGASVTHRVAQCQGRTLCPLAQFEAAVEAIVQPAGTLEEACRQ